jgi:hypothetical protein
MIKPPPKKLITPIAVSERWFPVGREFGLYEHGGIVAPNVTSILGWKYPFDKSKWVAAEPYIDHDAVRDASAERGTAVHLAMENWLLGLDWTPPGEYLSWIEPLQELVARADATLAVEIPIHHRIDGVGSYAGSCDGMTLVRGEVVIIDYKTKRPGKNVYPKFCKKQKLQLAAYSIAINSIYADQLPGPVSRGSLLFAHPEDGRPVTVVSAGGDELIQLQQEWLEILDEWTGIYGDDVAWEQWDFSQEQSNVGKI